jgi:CRISPR/Cas system CSM-associated protein Csm2 small subunit
MKFSAFFFLTAIAAEVISADVLQPQINTAYAFKDLTVSGLLLAAVVFLYRELARERKKTELKQEEFRVFIAEQVKTNKDTAESQSAVLSDLVSAMNQLTEASRNQVNLYNKHIEALVASATHRRNSSQ